MTFKHSFQPYRFDLRLPNPDGSTHIRRQLGIDLVYFERGEDVGQFGHVLDDFAHEAVAVHDFDATRARLDKHFFQGAAFAEDDIGLEGIGLDPQLTFQQRDMALILPNRVLKMLLLAPFHRVGPVATVLVPENTAAVILRPEHINAGPRNHHEVDFGHAPIALRQMQIGQQPIRLPHFFEMIENQKIAVRPLVQESFGKTVPAGGTVVGLFEAGVVRQRGDEVRENEEEQDSFQISTLLQEWCGHLRERQWTRRQAASRPECYRYHFLVGQNESNV